MALLLAACVSAPVHEQSWQEVRTRHFDISSSLGTNETQQLAEDLENFRSGVEYLVDAKLPAPALRTRVYAFDGRRVVRPFDRRGVSGYFLPSLDGGWIVLRTGGGWRHDATTELRFEFARYLFRNREGLDLPLWYDEGFGQFASTLEPVEGGIEVGLARPDFIHLLRDRLHLSVEGLIQLQDLTQQTAREREIFDAESWALVHYLTFESGSPAQARQRFRHYLDQVERGTSFRIALESSFGEGPAQIKKGVSRYVREKSFHSMVLRLPPRATRNPEPRTLEAPNARARLGWLAIELGRPETASRYFDMTLAEQPNNVSALAGRIAAARIDENWKAAESHYASALAIAPADPLVQLEGGHAALASAFRATSPSQARQRASLARERLQQSIQELATNPAAYTLLGRTYLVPGEDPSLGLSPITKARQLLPSSLEIELVRARLQLARGDATHAAYLAREIASRTTSKKLAAKALDLAREAREASTFRKSE